jgi:hypothetical protein
MGRFSETLVLGMLRHLIQHRQRFRLLLAGSPYSGRISALVGLSVECSGAAFGLPGKCRGQATHRTTDPQFSTVLRPDASQRILVLTNGHPFLLQLLCSEIIAHKNSQPVSGRFLVTAVDVETAVPAALERGSLFFADIEINQMPSSARPILHALSHQAEGAALPVDVVEEIMSTQHIGHEVLHRLLLREILRESPDGYQFHNELLRRWFLSM